MGTKKSKLAYLHAQLKFRDKIIKKLIHEIAKHKISLPYDLLYVINAIYYNKGMNNGRDTEKETGPTG